MPDQLITAIASDAVSGTYRFTIPIRSMIRRRWILGNVATGMPAQLSISARSTILLQRHVSLPDRIMDQMRKHGCRIVHDLDDLLWSIPHDNPNQQAFTSELISAMENQLRQAHLITVSTEPLALEARRRGFETTVVPNVLDPADWLAQPARAERTRIRVGWYGQRYVHAADLALLSDVVSALCDEVEFVFLGDYPKANATRIEAHLPVPLSIFPATLAALDLDIVLAPLAQNAFNECKSNLRLIQAGMLGYAAIASDTPSHAGLPVERLPNQPQRWIDAIRERAADRAALRAEGETLRRAVHAGFVIDQWVDRYWALWTRRVTPLTASA